MNSNDNKLQIDSRNELAARGKPAPAEHRQIKHHLRAGQMARQKRILVKVSIENHRAAGRNPPDNLHARYERLKRSEYAHFQRASDLSAKYHGIDQSHAAGRRSAYDHRMPANIAGQAYPQSHRQTVGYAAMDKPSSLASTQVHEGTHGRQFREYQRGGFYRTTHQLEAEARQAELNSAGKTGLSKDSKQLKYVESQRDRYVASASRDRMNALRGKEVKDAHLEGMREHAKEKLRERVRHGPEKTGKRSVRG